MRAAIYARRSTEEHQAESLDTQVENARRFIAAKGWTLEDAHVFTDSGVSRAEFKNRPGMVAMINASEAKAFEVVVMRDETRLGGDMLRTGLVIQDLRDHDVRLFFYVNGEEVRFEDATAKLVMAARNFSSELEREKVASRTRENLERKARRGLVAGGACYGYKNVRTPEGVHHEVDEDQKKIVVEVFERYADGDGFKVLAKDLNARGIKHPGRGKRSTGSWAPSCIREMLRRERYVGLISWGKTHKSYKGGTKVRLDAHGCVQIQTEAPHLRIVPDELWRRVQARFDKRTKPNGTERRGQGPKYLLTSIAKCAECGGPISSCNTRVGGETVRAYGCGRYKDRGPTVCSNSLLRPMAPVDELLVDYIATHVLTEGFVAAVCAEVRARLAVQAKAAENQLPALDAEVAALRAEIENLVGVMATSGDSSLALSRGLADREARLADLEARMRTAKTVPMAMDLQVRRVERDAKARMANLRGVLASNPAEARKLLEALIDGPLNFSAVQTDEGKRYQVRGRVGLDHLLGVEGLTRINSVPSGI